MKYINIYIVLILMAGATLSCGKQGDGDHSHTQAGHDNSAAEGEAHSEVEEVHLTPSQIEALDLEISQIEKRNVASVVQANGQLEVPPQNEAIVSPPIGANIHSIEVIEGDAVKKGQPLAYLSHPDLAELQSGFLELKSRFGFLEKEYKRQQNLVEAEIGAGKNLERISSEYEAAREELAGYRLKLDQLGIEAEELSADRLYRTVPLRSPISGYITEVGVKTGQYAQPGDHLFEVINTGHIHADLMVFERDVYRVRKKQKVRFRVETQPGLELTAIIFSVGKKFESDPKAVHVHAEIENKEGMLIPGMYIQGEILTDSLRSPALPEAAVVREGDRFFAFTLERAGNPGSEEEWIFRPVEVAVKESSDGWLAVQLMESGLEDRPFVKNNAYYLMAELKKGEGGHGHSGHAH